MTEQLTLNSIKHCKPGTSNSWKYSYYIEVSRFYFYIENHYQGMGNDSQTSKMIKFLSPRLIIQTEDFILISLTPLPSFCNCFYPAIEGIFSTFMTEKQGKLKSQSILSLNVYFLKCFLLEKGKPIYVKG